VTPTFGNGDVRLDRRVKTTSGPLERPTLLGGRRRIGGAS